jgi:hypothetical protein
MGSEPIACSLTADELPARLAEIRAVGEGSLVGSEIEGPVARLRFRADDELRSRLTAVVEAEARCCAFLEFDLSDHGREQLLVIRAPEGAGAEQVMRELAEAFQADAGAGRGASVR